uniref:Drebrin-like n=1 Tax=Neolamprologus brichardi TaxID=32507 RepID=A0A3Q4HA04_NEOBR
MDKKESEVEEAKAIIAQRSGNPREFFKQKERAMTISVDTSPVSIHRSGHEAISEQEIRKIIGDSVPKQEQKPPVQESTPTKPVQSVAPQARDSSAVSACESGTDSLVDLWDGSSAAPTNVAQPAQSSQSSNLVDLMGDVLHDNIPPSTAAASGRPQPLLSFDEMMDGTFCSGTGAEDDPSSLVDVTGSDQMTLSYQHALQHASGEGQELDDGQLLMTNGEALLKEGTQVSQVMLLVLSRNKRSDSRLIGRRFAHLLSLCWYGSAALLLPCSASSGAPELRGCLSSSCLLRSVSFGLR